MMFLIDTNILIYHLDNQPLATAFLDRHRGQMAISVISVAEVLSYPYTPAEMQAVERFLKENFVWQELTHDVVFKTAELRRTKKTKIPDAIIGAAAVLNGYSLVTRNEQDFKHLAIQLINPMQQ